MTAATATATEKAMVGQPAPDFDMGSTKNIEKLNENVKLEDYKGRCEPELATYSLDAAVDPTIKLFALYPTVESWNDHGHRTVTCIAASDFDRTGSLAG